MKQIGLLFILLLLPIPCIASGAVTIVNPSSDMMVTPGEIIPVNIEGDFYTIVLGCDTPLLCNLISDKKGMSNWSIEVPSDIQSGDYFIQAIGTQLEKGKPVFSERKKLTVGLYSFPMSIEFDPKIAFFDYIGDKIKIRVIAAMPDQTKVDITSHPETTIETSANLTRTGNTFVSLKAGQGFISVTYAINGSSVSASLPISIPQNNSGDLNGDGKVDVDDINILRIALKTLANAPNDARDLNHDGKITTKDVSLLKKLCTFKKCATQP
jgi:hypothetical protein